jgi:hypothetical protein
MNDCVEKKYKVPQELCDVHKWDNSEDIRCINCGLSYHKWIFMQEVIEYTAQGIKRLEMALNVLPLTKNERRVLTEAKNILIKYNE